MPCRCFLQLPPEAATPYILIKKGKDGSEHHADWRIENKRLGVYSLLGSCVVKREADHDHQFQVFSVCEGDDDGVNNSDVALNLL